MSHYFAVYKPYNMLSQFTRETPQQHVLGELHKFPKDVYALGRLDQDSEGLLLLTNDNALVTFYHKTTHERTYWVQTDGIATPEAIAALERGVTIKLPKEMYTTLPAKVTLITAPNITERTPAPKPNGKNEMGWLSITLTEGKNRQVRRMTAAVGFPTLRLVRAAISTLALDEMQVGEVREVAQSKVYDALGFKR